MYGFKRTCKINDVIKSMSEERSKPTIRSRPLENIIDPTMFPPCKVIVKNKLNVPGSSLMFTRQQLRHN